VDAAKGSRRKTEDNMSPRSLRAMLQHAKGQSSSIIAVTADIRDFSSFSKTVDSLEVAYFIKRVYLSLIDDYFPDATFYKPTGDGLLIVLTYEETTLAEFANSAINSAFKAIRDFPKLCLWDPAINFPVPDRLAIGIARGSACCLTSNGEIIDYSGKVLNLSSRLVDFARPQGLVIDSSFKLELLKPQLRKQFEHEDVFIRGVSERTPSRIYFQKSNVTIHPNAKKPLSKSNFQQRKESVQLKSLALRGERFRYELPGTPSPSSLVNLELHYPQYKSGKRVGTLFWIKKASFTPEKSGGGTYHAIVDFTELAKRIRDKGTKLKDVVDLIWSFELEM